MKKLILLNSVLALTLTVGAQTILNNSLNDPTNSVIERHVISFYQNVESNRTVSVAVYPSYAPGIVVNDKKYTFGFGLAVLCPMDVIPNLQSTYIGQHGYGGLRFDYLAGQAFASTIGVGMKEDFQLWNHNFTIFQQASANIPFRGFGVHNMELGAAVGGGLYTPIVQFSPTCSLSLQISAEKWTQFAGEVFHGGPVFTVSF